MKTRIQMTRIYFAVLAALMLAGSCSGNRYGGDMGRAGEERYLDSLANVYSQYATSGRNDTVLMHAGVLMREALQCGDTLKALYACVFAAQSWMYEDNLDSLRFYLDVARSHIQRCDNPFLNIVFNNASGCYSLRAGLDYTLALNYYMTGLHWAEICGSVGNQTAMLLNIANIFYMQRNSEGYSYAQKALDMAMASEDVGTYVRSAANINMAQMLFLKGDVAGAEKCMSEAWRLARDNSLYPLYSPIFIMYAGIYEKNGDTAKATGCYEEASGYSRYTDHGTMSQICLEYGKFLKRQKDYAGALDKFREGLELSEQSGSLEFRLELLGAMADCCWLTGDRKASLAYYRRYSEWQDSIAVEKQYEFNRTIMSVREIEHEKELLEQELEQQRLKHQVNIMTVTSVMAVLVLFLIFLMYDRKKKAYRALFQQHRHYMQKLEQEKKVMAVASSPSKEVFRKIEDLVCGQKYFMKKGVSLEEVAEKVHINRTYCSKAINTFAGCSFYKWLDALRIEEATRRMIADSSVLIKQLADELGYSSVSSFSKAFYNEIGCTPSNYREACRNKLSVRKN